ncbi:ectoine/hydroxyectoine ABC transporter substrate-binding protein EhuB [Bradyrhizobium sp. 144]|uniref:ectoine/hydroxyectoine ABC transporter substrate-binding protein EhuB n=1 Tax=Bradyrhizobium sp. 144 TaxID=2782620 RepID=UPI001FFAF978|nr:ectoine/hydroxyectoine ABC transporter substrate-binding protein EhuB [Bradyrhizobium sp. 144]MCK1692458.1 ectoine/hydroxyectoine ABC transporter substrate-binding protein EhuB [Bradyrhizobium sp. 144]
MSHRRNIRSLCVARLGWALAVLISGSALSLQAVSATTLEEARSNGVTIAIANEPPWMFLEPDGSPAGLGPERDMAILREVGITKFNGQTMEYGAIIPAIQSKRATLSSSGALVVKPERCQAAIFSNPVTCGGETFLLPVALVGKVKSYRDVADQSLKIGVCGGCTQQRLAIEAGVKADNILVYPDSTSAMKLLSDKRIDVFATTDSVALDLQKRLSDPSVTQVVRAEGAKLVCAAAAFSKESTELRDAYNEGLRKIIASGKYMELAKKYGREESTVGVTTGEKVTTEQLCTR